ncbi:hypothetical protein J7L00_04215 [Candidatus Bathyarchaeota archaeon]|nr:hypothetical protein [Candidatus Bathyarchaeota archaeon]
MSDLGCFAQINKTEIDPYETVTISVACALCSQIPNFPIYLIIDAPGALPPYVFEQGTCQDFIVSKQYDFFYTEAGTYYITVIVNNDKIAKFEVKVSKPPAPPLKVNLKAQPDMGYAPLEVKFTVEWSGGVPPINFVIEYPDGESDEARGVTSGYPKFTHTLNQPGVNLVKVTATDSIRQVTSDWVIVEVLPPPLLVDLSADVTDGEAPLNVVFTAFTFGGTPPITITMDYGNGAPPESKTFETADGGERFAHTYDNPGTYIATASAIDSQGQEDSKTLTITVREPAPPPPPPPPPISWETIAIVGGVGVAGAIAAYLAYRYYKKRKVT